MNLNLFAKLIDPKLYFQGLEVLYLSNSYMAECDESSFADLMWPTKGPDNKDHLGAALLYGFYKEPLRLPQDTRDKDIPTLISEANDIIGKLPNSIYEICQKGQINEESLGSVEGPFKYYLLDFLDRASRIEWIKKGETETGFIYYPSDKFCQGFIKSNIYDSTKRRIGFR